VNVVVTVNGVASNAMPYTPPPVDFTASVASAARVLAGASTSYAVTAGAVNGFSGTVNLAASGLPAGATATFNPASVTGSGSRP
jgi:hypothetical protein